MKRRKYWEYLKINKNIQKKSGIYVLRYVYTDQYILFSIYLQGSFGAHDAINKRILKKSQIYFSSF